MRYLENIAIVIFKSIDDKNLPQRLDNRETLLAIIIGNIMKLIEIGNHPTRRP